MSPDVRVVTVDASNVAQESFFCYKSKPKSEGYRLKLNWLMERFSEGMRMRILYEGARSVAFIEYIPGEYTWRAVKAPGYMVVQCLWTVGKGKGKGYATRLLGKCVDDARQLGMNGVTAVTSSGTWLVDKKIFLKNGFEAVDKAPPSFDLLVKRFNDAPLPSFPTDWEKRSHRYGAGLTVLRSDQCPYIEDATKCALEIADELGLESRVVEVENCRQAQDLAPSPYGVFNVVYNGQLASYTYILGREKRNLIKLVEQSG